MGGNERVQRALRGLLDESLEGGRRDTLPPVLAPDPVADEPALLAVPATEVAGRLAVHLYGADDVARVRADLLPVRVEGLLVAGREVGHRDSDRIALVLVEDREVFVGDFAENYRQDLVASPAAERFGESLSATGIA